MATARNRTPAPRWTRDNTGWGRWTLRAHGGVVLAEVAKVQIMRGVYFWKVTGPGLEDSNFHNVANAKKWARAETAR